MALNPKDLDALSTGAEKLAATLGDLAWGYIVQTLAKHIDGKDDLKPDEWRQQIINHAGEVATAVRAAGRQPFQSVARQLDEYVATVPIAQQQKMEPWLASLAEQHVFTPPKSLQESKAVTGIVEAARAQSRNYVAMAERGMSKEATRVFKGIVSDAALAIKNGKAPREGMAQAAEQWAEQGVPTLVDKAGRHWQPDTYLRLVVQTQVKQTTNDVMIARTKETSGLVKVSSHLACRPTHLDYQGRVYSVTGDTAEYPDLYQATNFGSAGGLGGINCHHYVMTYVPGYDTPDMDTLDPDSNNAAYALTQKQRRLEREVRAAKREQVAAKEFGSDARIAKANRLVRSRQHQLKTFVDSHPNALRRDYSREKILAATGREAEKAAASSQYVADLRYLRSKAFQGRLLSDREMGGIAKQVQSVTTQMLRHRNGTPYEDIALLDRDTGAVLSLYDGSVTEHSIDKYPHSMLETIRNAERNSMVVVHNHPMSVPPSPNDLRALQSNYKGKTAYGIVAGHDGTMYVYTRATKPLPDSADLNMMITAAAKKELTGSKDTRWLRALNKVGEEYGFKVRKV
ncbi:phage minor capsid protein [Lacticaseibacillus parakribbianus]|uniref:phage minor capsid protein n=1 Tax=Lacticaseibacillus parakribbianus TaxID=2970927 RepID=UPI0021CAE814|nr:phage minor capsid protein [Lacticaseibacillus parakribbianus]